MKNLFSGFFAFFLLISSCSTDKGIQQILGVNAEAPVFIECRPASSTEIVFAFSKSVKLVSLNFDQPIETGSIQEGKEITITLARPFEAGIKVTADILVEDSSRNTLNVIVPFRARNDRMPAIVFNELRFDNSASNFKAEFVEFITLASGNLGAMRLYIAHQSLSTPFYEFPPVEVKAGEYIVLHTRTLEDGCVDETRNDLGLSAGVEAEKTARDFWIPGSNKYLHNTNGLWLLDQDDAVIDALLFCDNEELTGVSAALTKTFTAASDFLIEKSAWVSTAVYTKGTSNTKTLCRDETIPHERRAENWYITAVSCATPGSQNNPKRNN